jgi:hydroxyacylglutathione hydrolase
MVGKTSIENPPRGVLRYRRFELGGFATNAYVAWRENLEERGCVLIDAPPGVEPVLAFLEQAGLTPTRVLLTHAHADHIAGLPAVRQAFPGLPVAVHDDESAFLGDAALNLSLYFAEPLSVADAEETLADGQTIDLAGTPLHVLHTPGHSPGGVTFHDPAAGVAFVGDTLFAGSIGRYDFPTSDGSRLLRSIHERLLALPDDTVVLPGHGGATSIGRERKGNPYLR